MAKRKRNRRGVSAPHTACQTARRDCARRYVCHNFSTTCKHSEQNATGWSFGGIIAVQIAHMLAQRGRGLRVSRIILIDSVYPRCERPEARKGLPHPRHAPMLPGISEDIRDKLLTALMRATCISDRWDPPTWARRPTGRISATRLVDVNLKPLPPPVVLIRADGMVPTKDAQEMCPLDRTRFLPQLGWEDMQEGFVSHVLHTSGNHYNIFDEDHAPMTTACLRKALEIQ